MKISTISLVILAITFFASSCYEEDPITPSDSSEQVGRFTFPQGDGSNDIKLKAIYDKFGVKVIYKDFTNEDFGLSWTSPATGKVGFDIGENEYNDVANFMADYFFAALTPEITKRVLPPYFYVADSVYAISSSGPGNELKSATYTTHVYDGRDFWLFTWNGCQPWNIVNGKVTLSKRTLSPTYSSFNYFYRRGVMLKEVFRGAVLNGNIEVPADFSTGFDFTTKIVTTPDTDANYYKTRGFPGQLNNKLNFNLGTLALITSTSPKQNFIDYMLLCMRYSEDSIKILYPPAKYPLINQKYPLVINYMKDKYGVDLNELSKKPEL